MLDTKQVRLSQQNDTQHQLVDFIVALLYRMHGSGTYTSPEGVAWQGEFFNGKYYNGKAYISLHSTEVVDVFKTSEETDEIDGEQSEAKEHAPEETKE